MSPRTTICPDCGNEISRWDNGVYPVCSLGGYSIDERGSLVMYGGDDISKFESLFYRYPTPIVYNPIPPQEQTHQTPSSITKPSPSTAELGKNTSRPGISASKVTSKEIRGFGFDRLLRDIYGKEITFTEILVKLGEPAHKLQNKSRNSMWSLVFLESLEIAIHASLRTISNCQPKVLIYWYGLDGNYPRSIYKIAGELGISIQQVEFSRKASMQFLKSREGMRRLEQEILKWSKTDI